MCMRASEAVPVAESMGFPSVAKPDRQCGERMCKDCDSALDGARRCFAATSGRLDRSGRASPVARDGGVKMRRLALPARLLLEYCLAEIRSSPRPRFRSAGPLAAVGRLQHGPATAARA